MTTVFVVGGGHSLAGFNWSLLDRSQVIAVNNQCKWLPHADTLIWSDVRFWYMYGRHIKQHSAPLKLTALLRGDRFKYPDDYGITVWQFTGMLGLDLTPGKLRHGNSSAYAAVNAAIHRKPRPSRIVLLGIDGNFSRDGRSHHHSDYGNNIGIRQVTNTTMAWPSLVEPLNEISVEIINASAHSAIDCFPRMDRDEAVREFASK